MQASDHYFTSQICIFLLINYRQLFFLPLEIPFSEWACDLTQVKTWWECSIGEITFLAKLAYSTIDFRCIFLLFDK